MWGVIPIYIRRNKTISDKSKLLYAEISDCTDDDGFCRRSNDQLAEYLDVSVSTLRNHLYELRDCELICIDGDGKDRRISFPERLVTVSFKGEKKSPEKRADLAEIVVAIWNEEIMGSRGIRITDPLIKSISARSKHFSDEEIILAVKNRVKLVTINEWYNKPENSRHKKDIYLVIRSDRDLEKHLNLRFEDGKISYNEIKTYTF